MKEIQRAVNRHVTEENIDSDFEYNFDLQSFNYLVQGIHNLIVIPITFISGLTVSIFQHLKNRIHDDPRRHTFMRHNH